MDAVVTGVDDKLNTMAQEEVAHRHVTLLDRLKRSLRQLCQCNVLPARVRRPAARRPVGGHRDDVEAPLDQVAEVRALPRNADAELQRSATRSGPVSVTTSPPPTPPPSPSSRPTTTS